jgi:hypothetical protein
MQIHLANGAGTATVDDEDYYLVAGVNWSLHSAGYAHGRLNGTMVLMHRLILSSSPGAMTDHVNGNKLDNRRQNLRTCSHGENMRNRKKHRNNRSGVKGVYLESRTGRSPKWIAQICTENVQRRLGAFDDIEAAKLAYQLAAEKYHGEFARLS